MELFRQTDYKQLLRERQKEVVRERPILTWKYIADKIRLQHTYLSRSFHNAKVHLGEDHLFEVLDLLRLDMREKEFLMMLRSRDLAVSKSRRAYLQSRVDAMISEHHVRVNSLRKEASPEETAFLLNPTLLLIYVALHVKKYAQSPPLLERVFGLTPAQLGRHLKELEKMGFIQMGKVIEVKQNSIHFSKEHPLMRGHQQILRHLSAARFARVEDAEKLGFMVTFTASNQALELIRKEFYKFLTEAQKIAATGDGERVYQLGFDLFPWD